MTYSNRNKRLSLRKREAGCSSEAKNLTEKRLNLVHNDAPEAVDLLNEHLVELGREACSRLVVSGFRSASEFSKTNPDSESNAQVPPVTFKAYELKDNSRALLGNQDRPNELHIESSKVASRSSPSSLNFPQNLCSTAKEVDPLLKSEFLEPISYIRDAHKVSVILPKEDYAYNMLQAAPFTDC